MKIEIINKLRKEVLNMLQEKEILENPDEVISFLNSVIAEESFIYGVKMEIYHDIKKVFQPSIEVKKVVIQNSRQQQTQKEIRQITKEYIMQNGASGINDIFQYFSNLSHDTTKQQIVNALSQGGMFVFQRCEKNSKKFGKWILKSN